MAACPFASGHLAASAVFSSRASAQKGEASSKTSPKGTVSGHVISEVLKIAELEKARNAQVAVHQRINDKPTQIVERCNIEVYLRLM
jgi:hypothetical protein